MGTSRAPLLAPLFEALLWGPETGPLCWELCESLSSLLDSTGSLYVHCKELFFIFELTNNLRIQRHFMPQLQSAIHQAAFWQ